MTDRNKWRAAVLASDLPSGVKVVAFAIAEHAGTYKLECWPGYELLAQESHLAQRTIRASVARLVADGFVEKNTIWDRDHSAVRMVLTVPNRPASQCRSIEEPTGIPMPTDRHSHARPTGIPMPPYIEEPELEPEKNPGAPEAPAYRGKQEASAFVRRGSDEWATKIRIAKAACELAGIDMHNPPSIDGVYVDTWIIDTMPANAMRRMVDRCVAGKLSNLELWNGLCANGIIDRLAQLRAA